MTVVIREARQEELQDLFELLLLAEPSERALRWSFSNLIDTIYRMTLDGELVGAATMQWSRDPCEIIELAIAPERQGQGLGRRLISWLLNEARRRGMRRMLVGTTNASIGNIIFYQKCGFRMDHVRRDYFWYHRQPIHEKGIRVRDMLVFEYNLEAGSEVPG